MTTEELKRRRRSVRTEFVGTTVFDRYFEKACIIARNQREPLREERERFLAHLEAAGVCRESLRKASYHLLHIIDILRLGRLRNVTMEEIEQAAKRWTELRRKQGYSRIGNEGTFKLIARQFFKFFGKIESTRVDQPFAKYLADFVEAMTNDLVYAAPTISQCRFRASHFLRWYGEQRRRFREIRPADIAAYLDFSSGSDLRARRNQAQSLRTFFRHAVKRCWCRSALATAVAIPLPPLLRKPPEEPQGPAWKDVVRLLDSVRGTEASEVRDRAMLSLFATHGLRVQEVVDLLVSDMDWKENRLVVRRHKRNSPQFLLDQDVVTALRCYVENARPRCSFPNLFVSAVPPFRPVNIRTISGMVRRRMLRLGIPADKCGPYCLRHARATRLLDTGRSFQDVAEFLGHASTQRIKLYASSSIRKLSEVAAADLVGAL